MNNRYFLIPLSKLNYQEAIAIARSLPEWFTDSGLKIMESDLPFQSGWIVHSNVGTPQTALGFISFFVNQAIAEISWMGVRPESFSQGIGRRMLEHLVSELKNHAVNELQVRTLGDSVEYIPYSKTRAFYHAYGFQDLQRLPHPDRPEYSEELLMVLKF